MFQDDLSRGRFDSQIPANESAFVSRDTREGQPEFLTELASFIRRVEQMPRFRGQTQALRALRRISSLSALSS